MRADSIYNGDLVTDNYPAFEVSAIQRTGLINTPHMQSEVTTHSTLVSPGLSASLGCDPESSSQTGYPSSSSECYTLRKQVPLKAIIVTGSNKFVPQTLDKPFTETGKERYLDRVTVSTDHLRDKGPLVWGISLEDIRKGKV